MDCRWKIIPFFSVSFDRSSCRWFSSYIRLHHWPRSRQASGTWYCGNLIRIVNAIATEDKKWCNGSRLARVRTRCIRSFSHSPIFSPRVSRYLPRCSRITLKSLKAHEQCANGLFQSRIYVIAPARNLPSTKT